MVSTADLNQSIYRFEKWAGLSSDTSSSKINKQWGMIHLVTEFKTILWSIPNYYYHGQLYKLPII